MSKTANQRAAEGLRKQGWMTNRDVRREFPWVARWTIAHLRERGDLQYFIPYPGAKTIYYRREEIEGMFKFPDRILPEAELAGLEMAGAV